MSTANISSESVFDQCEGWLRDVKHELLGSEPILEGNIEACFKRHFARYFTSVKPFEEYFKKGDNGAFTGLEVSDVSTPSMH